MSNNQTIHHQKQRAFEQVCRGPIASHTRHTSSLTLCHILLYSSQVYSSWLLPNTMLTWHLLHRSKMLSPVLAPIIYLLHHSNWEKREKIIISRHKKQSFINYTFFVFASNIRVVRCDFNQSIIFGRKIRIHIQSRRSWPTFHFIQFLIGIYFATDKQANQHRKTHNEFDMLQWSRICGSSFRFRWMPNKSWKWIWDKWNWVDFCNISFDLVTRLLDSAMHTTSLSRSLCCSVCLAPPSPTAFRIHSSRSILVLAKIDDEIKRKTIRKNDEQCEKVAERYKSVAERGSWTKHTTHIYFV